jgi:RNA polymerase sigma factor (sigma-70 family)
LYFLKGTVELPTEIDAYRYLKWKIRNLAIDNMRRRQVFDKTEHLIGPETLEASWIDLSDHLVDAENAAIVRESLGKLSQSQRTVLLRHEVMKESHSQIASELQITENNSRQLLRRARASFANELRLTLAQRGRNLREFLQRGGPAALLVILSVPFIGVAFSKVPMTLQGSPVIELPVEPRLQALPPLSKLGGDELNQIRPSEGTATDFGTISVEGNLEKQLVDGGPIDEKVGSVGNGDSPAPSGSGYVQPDDYQTLSSEVSSLGLFLDDAVTTVFKSLDTEMDNSTFSVKDLPDNRVELRWNKNGLSGLILFEIPEDGSSAVINHWATFQAEVSQNERYVLVPKSSYLEVSFSSEGKIKSFEFVATDFFVGDTGGSLDFASSEQSSFRTKYLVLSGIGKGIESNVMVVRSSFENSALS